MRNPIRIGYLLTQMERKRLTLDMSEAEHRALKTRAAAVGLPMKDLILELLRREGWTVELLSGGQATTNR